MQDFPRFFPFFCCCEMLWIPWQLRSLQDSFGGGGQVHRGDSCRTNPGKDPERAANDFAVRCSGDALKILREHSLGSSTRTRNACCISRRIDISLRKDPDDFLGGVVAETLEPFFEIL